MKKHLTFMKFLSVLLLSYPVSSALADTAKNYQLYMDRAERDALNWYKKGGLSQLNNNVVDCYIRASDKRTLDGEHEWEQVPDQEDPGYKVCYLIDNLTYQLDQERRRLVKKKTGKDPGPAMTYFEDKNAFGRFVLYAMSFFPTIKEGQDLARKFTDHMMPLFKEKSLHLSPLPPPPALYDGDWFTLQQASISRRAFHDFRKAYIKNGSDGLAEQVMKCYDTSLKALMKMKDGRTLEERIRHSDALKACYLEDETAIEIFSSGLECLKRGKTDYFSDNAPGVMDRKDEYRDLLFYHAPDNLSDDDYLVQSFSVTMAERIGNVIPCMKHFYLYVGMHGDD